MSKTLNEWKGVPEGSDVTGIIFCHCGLHVCKILKTNENVSFTRVLWQDRERRKARMTAVLAASHCYAVVQIVREIAQCVARIQRRRLIDENERHFLWERSSMMATCEDRDVVFAEWPDVVKNHVSVKMKRQKKGLVRSCVLRRVCSCCCSGSNNFQLREQRIGERQIK